MSNRRKGQKYSPNFKFQVVLELLQGSKTTAQAAKAFGVHPITLVQWKKEFLEKGPEIFERSQTLAEYRTKIKNLERLIDQKDLELALYKNFLDEQ